MNIIDEASQVLAYSRQLEQKSRELEAATNELRSANRRLQELDRLKDDFISTVTHELRTPLTSIRAFSEILNDNPELDGSQRAKFLGIIIKESERLTRLINQVLDLAKIESGNAEWHSSEIDMREVVEDSITAVSQLFKDQGVALEASLPQQVPPIVADRDRLMQVMLNLLSNAASSASVLTAGSPSHWAVMESNCGWTSRQWRRHQRLGPGRDFRQVPAVGDTLTQKPRGAVSGSPSRGKSSTISAAGSGQQQAGRRLDILLYPSGPNRWESSAPGSVLQQEYGT